jgi:hypothetical protein
MAITAIRPTRFPICWKRCCIWTWIFSTPRVFPVRDPKAMSLKHKFGNWVLSLAMSLLYFRWVRDSQSGMWVFRRSILEDMHLESDGMAFSEEIKIEALKNSAFASPRSPSCTPRGLGEIKLNPWRDGFYNLFFLVKKAIREIAGRTSPPVFSG